MKIALICFLVVMANEGLFNFLQRQPADKAPKPVNDTLFVKIKTAVFYYPSARLAGKKIKKIGENNYRIGEKDNLDGLNEVAKSCKKAQIPITEARNRRYLIFLQPDGSRTGIKLDTLTELWGVFLFEPEKQPKLLDLMDFDQEIRAYY